MTKPIKEIWETTDSIQHDCKDDAKRHQVELDFAEWYELNQLLNVPRPQMFRWCEEHKTELRRMLGGL
jgi:hypothetical protein